MKSERQALVASMLPEEPDCLVVWAGPVPHPLGLPVGCFLKCSFAAQISFGKNPYLYSPLPRTLCLLNLCVPNTPPPSRGSLVPQILGAEWNRAARCNVVTSLTLGSWDLRYLIEGITISYKDDGRFCMRHLLCTNGRDSGWVPLRGVKDE